MKRIYYWEATPVAPRGKFILGRFFLSASRPAYDCESFLLYHGEDIRDIKRFLAEKGKRLDERRKAKASMKISGSVKEYSKLKSMSNWELTSFNARANNKTPYGEYKERVNREFTDQDLWRL